MEIKRLVSRIYKKLALESRLIDEKALAYPYRYQNLKRCYARLKNH